MNTAGPITGSSIDDDTVLAPGEVIYFLITRLDQCRESITGADSSGGTRPDGASCLD